MERSQLTDIKSGAQVFDATNKAVGTVVTTDPHAGEVTAMIDGARRTLPHSAIASYGNGQLTLKPNWYEFGATSAAS